jgi:hypothetical protein
MKEIIVRRYYLSDFMYDNYKDDPTNIYDGFFVDLMPDTRHNDYTEFWLGHDMYACRDFMFGIKNEDCDTDEKAQDFIERNEWQYIEDFVDKYFNDYECDCEHCYEIKDAEIDGSLLEAIEMHNNHVDKMQDLAQSLLDTYPEVESTPVNDAFGEAFSSLIGNAIYLCCEANSYGDCKWITTGDWKVVEDDVEG